MSQNNYVSTNVEKIIKKEKHPYPVNFALASAWILGNFKGTELKIYDVSKKSSITDMFVIATASNQTQANAMADEIVNQLKINEQEILSLEGTETAEWILVDAGDLFIHIFQESARKEYALDRVWEESPQIKIPNDYYFTTPQEEKKNNETSNDYF